MEGTRKVSGITFGRVSFFGVGFEYGRRMISVQLSDGFYEL